MLEFCDETVFLAVLLVVVVDSLDELANGLFVMLGVGQDVCLHLVVYALGQHGILVLVAE